MPDNKNSNKPKIQVVDGTVINEASGTPGQVNKEKYIDRETALWYKNYRKMLKEHPYKKPKNIPEPDKDGFYTHYEKTRVIVKWPINAKKVKNKFGDVVKIVYTTPHEPFVVSYNRIRKIDAYGNEVNTWLQEQEIEHEYIKINKDAPDKIATYQRTGVHEDYIIKDNGTIKKVKVEVKAPQRTTKTLLKISKYEEISKEMHEINIKALDRRIRDTHPEITDELIAMASIVAFTDETDYKIFIHNQYNKKNVVVVPPQTKK